jgi:hypothetical protein
MNAPVPETNTGCLLVIDDQESNIQVVGATFAFRLPRSLLSR